MDFGCGSGYPCRSRRVSFVLKEERFIRWYFRKSSHRRPLQKQSGVTSGDAENHPAEHFFNGKHAFRKPAELLRFTDGKAYAAGTATWHLFFGQPAEAGTDTSDR